MKWVRLVQVALWAVALAGAGLFGLYNAGVLGPNLGRSGSAGAPTVAQIGGPFSLTSHKGARITDQDLKGARRRFLISRPC